MHKLNLIIVAIIDSLVTGKGLNFPITWKSPLTRVREVELQILDTTENKKYKIDTVGAKKMFSTHVTSLGL